MPKFVKLFFSLLLVFSLFFASPQGAHALISSCALSLSANSQDNYPVNHADINLQVRNWQTQQIGERNRIGTVHPGALDPRAPQLNTIFEQNPTPAIGALYAVCNWAWDGGTGPGGHRENSTVSIDEKPSDYASLVTLQGSGNVLVPQSGYNIGDNRQVIVLYAAPNSITIKYGIEDSIVTEAGHGYAIHIENINVASDVLAAYQSLNSAGRSTLPALCAGHILGTSNGEILVSVRDSGGFMDPRWLEDWWDGGEIGRANNSCGIKPVEVKKVETLSRAPKIEALLGRDAYCRLENCQEAEAGGAGKLKDPQNRFEKAPYCPALGINQDPDFPSFEDFRTCSLDASKTPVGQAAFYSCPDYAPNRPYPGDTCLNYQDLAKDNINITEFSQPALKKTTKIKYKLCTKCSRRSTDCLGNEHIVKAWVKDNVTLTDQSFVEYLGTTNEYTSNPNYIMSLQNDILRTSLFLTDYLRGFFSAPGDADRSDEMLKFLWAKNDYINAMNKADAWLKQNMQSGANSQTIYDQYFAQTKAASDKYNDDVAKIPDLGKRLQMASGVMNKLYPEEFKKGSNFDSNKVLLQRWLYANLPSGNGKKPTDKITGTPIGDYVIAYQCAVKGRKVMDEEDFPDSLERRKVIINWGPSKGKECKPVSVLRISDFLCSNIEKDAAGNVIRDIFGQSEVEGLKRDQICRGKDTHFSDETNATIFWPNYFPLTTREDTPVRVVLKCPSLAMPLQFPEASDDSFPEEDFRKFDADTLQRPAGFDAETGERKFWIAHRFYVYIGHLAEARELSYYVGNALLPAGLKLERKQDLKDIKEKLSLSSDLRDGKAQAVPAATGDLLAEDANIRYITEKEALYKSDSAVGTKVILTDGDKKAIADYEDKCECSTPPCSSPGEPPTKIVEIKGQECTVSVEMPFIWELAERTVGKENGFLRLFLPKKVGDELYQKIEANENQGASVAYTKYDGFGKQLLEPGLEYQINIDEFVEDRGRFYVPWVKQMQAFQTVAIGQGLNPATFSQSSTGASEQGPAKYKSTPEYIQCLTKNINFKDAGSRPAASAFEEYRQKFPDSWLNKPEGRLLWNDLINIAAAAGFNPVLALAYWGEETHFTNPTDNPHPRQALGCARPDNNPNLCGDYPSDRVREFREQFQCLVSQNKSVRTCNLNPICREYNENEAWKFIGCYQFGVKGSSNEPNTPSDTHVKNLISIYYTLLGGSAPNCDQYLK